jgi:hypothetical protein
MKNKAAHEAAAQEAFEEAGVRGKVAETQLGAYHYDKLLKSSTDLQTIRAALAAPVRGLGLAFGTSVAGVAASAMLGLMSALCRRERLQLVQRLDSAIATTLRGFSAAQQLSVQRQAVLATLQTQAQALPEMLGQLQALVQRMDQHGQSLAQGLDQQARALTQAMERQAQAMDQRAVTLGHQLDQQAQALAERLLAGQDGFHRQAETVYSQLASSVDRSLQHSLAESARVAGATLQPVAEATLAGIARQTGELHQRLADTVQQQLDGLAQRFGESVDGVSQVWTAALAAHERTSARLAEDTRGALDGFAQGFETRSLALADGVAQRATALVQDLEQRSASLARQVEERTAAVVQALEQRSAALVQLLEQRAAALSQDFEQRSATLVDRVARSQSEVLAAAAASDAQRLSAWTEQLAALARSLQHEWQQAGASTLAQQQQICAALEHTARDIGTQAEAQARSTIAEIARLMQVASEAPRVAAEVIAALRQQLSDSLVRDNALLDERGRLMATLEGLLEAVTRTTTEQRGAVQALVESSAALLDRVGQRFGEQVAAESDRLGAAATQLTGSAVEVASLGEAFGTAVQLFGESNERMLAQLQRVEGTLAQAITRSDEQLAYYVAQAREIIDLSLLSQKQVVDDLQRLTDRQQALA